MAIKLQTAVIREFSEAEREKANGRISHLSDDERKAVEQLRHDIRQSDSAREVLLKQQTWMFREFGNRIVDDAISPKETEAIQAVEHWAASKQWALVLSGGVGCGKTISAAHYAYASAVNGWGRPTVINASRLPFAPVFGSEGADFVDRHGSIVSQLIIDDLGCEVVSAPIVALIGAIVDERYRKELETIITTNLTISQFVERYGQRVVDRILDNGTWQQLSGKSMRGEK